MQFFQAVIKHRHPALSVCIERGRQASGALRFFPWSSRAVENEAKPVSTENWPPSCMSFTGMATGSRKWKECDFQDPSPAIKGG